MSIPLPQPLPPDGIVSNGPPQGAPPGMMPPPPLPDPQILIPQLANAVGVHPEAVAQALATLPPDMLDEFLVMTFDIQGQL